MADSIAVAGGTSIRPSQMIGVGEAAKLLGLHPNTVRKMADDGILPAYRYANGHRRWLRKEVVEYATGEDLDSGAERVVIIYCRVSTTRQSQLKENKHGEKSSDLQRQTERMQIEATNRYPELRQVVLAETGSGMNYERKILNRFLDEVLAGKWDNSVLLVENRDRLVRFAAPLIEKILGNKGIEVIYTAQEDNTAEQDFSADILACIHYFSIKYYSSRQSSRNRAVLSSEIIEKAKRLMDAGYSIKKAADILNAEGYRTEGGSLLHYSTLNKHVYKKYRELSKIIPTIESSARQYKREFIEEAGIEDIVPIHLVYEHYKNWAEENNLVVATKRRFGAEFPHAIKAWYKNEGRQWASWRGFKVRGPAGKEINAKLQDRPKPADNPRDELFRYARGVMPFVGTQTEFYKKYSQFIRDAGKQPLTQRQVAYAMVDVGFWEKRPKGGKHLIINRGTITKELARR